MVGWFFIGNIFCIFTVSFDITNTTGAPEFLTEVSGGAQVLSLARAGDSQERMFNVFEVIKFPNDPCTTVNGNGNVSGIN